MTSRLFDQFLTVTRMIDASIEHILYFPNFQPSVGHHIPTQKSLQLKSGNNRIHTYFHKREYFKWMNMMKHWSLDLAYHRSKDVFQSYLQPDAIAIEVLTWNVFRYRNTDARNVCWYEFFLPNGTDFKFVSIIWNS